MARRRENGIELVASIIGCSVWCPASSRSSVFDGIGWTLSASANAVFAAIGRQANAGVFRPFARLALFGCRAGTLLSRVERHRRRRLLETQTGLDSLRAIRGYPGYPRRKGTRAFMEIPWARALRSGSR